MHVHVRTYMNIALDLNVDHAITVLTLWGNGQRLCVATYICDVIQCRSTGFIMEGFPSSSEELQFMTSRGRFPDAAIVLKVISMYMFLPYTNSLKNMLLCAGSILKKCTYM